MADIASTGHLAPTNTKCGFLFMLISVSLVATEASCTAYRYISTEIEIDRIKGALQQFQRCNGRLPSSNEGLSALSDNPDGSTSWHGPYIAPTLVDDWGEPYVYLNPARHGPDPYDLYSIGGNRTDDRGEGDDITSCSGASSKYYRHGFDWEVLVISGVLLGVGAILGAIGTTLVGRARRRVPVAGPQDFPNSI